MTEFSDIFSYAHTIIAFFGMSFNLFLIYLAIFQTPKVIKSYSTLIINFALTDFFACFFDFFVQQRIIPAGKTLGYISNGVCKHFSPDVCYVGYSLMLHFLSHSLWSLLLSFSYRYYILFRPAPDRITIISLLLLIYFPSFFQWISLLWAQDEPSEIVKILHVRFPNYNLDGYTVTGTKNIFCFSALYTILHMTLPITPVYICILILRNRIVARLSFQGVSMTKNTKNLHKQLLMALTFQAIIPGFYLFSVGSYALGQFGIYNHPALEYFTFSSFLFIPFLSPLASFIFVTPYRNFILRRGHKSSRIDMSSTQPQNTTTSLAYIG
ncbi:unnamed protein product [Caenorhabditis angaria]|uniref:G-protein coupled receptors family 1 profile domain-containing protein n=1 Tax=Caenorhabditis angaria TaxID=860376 RepID=A0A9P1IMM7_9PELO|nr:unnamed protein product [Caenorhabditis angaria]